MNNLVEQSSQWLQSEECRSGNILERTIAVIACFWKYVAEEKTEICDNTGLSLSTIMEKIDQKTVGTGKCLAQHLQCHLRGGLSFRGCCIIQIPSLEGKRMET